MERWEAQVLAKLDGLKEAQGTFREEVLVEFAKLPHTYVPREEIIELKKEARSARRWAIGIGVSIMAVLAPVLYSIIL